MRFETRNILIAFGLSTIAGLSTGFGSLIGLFTKKTNKDGGSYLITQEVTVSLKNSVLETSNGTQFKTKVIYGCSSGKFRITNDGYKTDRWYDEGKWLTNMLKKVCSYVEPKPSTQDNTKQVVTPKKVKTGYVAPLNPQQIVDTTKQIQQSLGIQNPTGQLTTSDVDMIISKLS